VLLLSKTAKRLYLIAVLIKKFLLLIMLRILMSHNRKSFWRLHNPLLIAACKAIMDQSSHMDRRAPERLSRFRDRL